MVPSAPAPPSNKKRFPSTAHIDASIVRPGSAEAGSAMSESPRAELFLLDVRFLPFGVATACAAKAMRLEVPEAAPERMSDPLAAKLPRWPLRIFGAASIEDVEEGSSFETSSHKSGTHSAFVSLTVFRRNLHVRKSVRT